MVCKSAKSPMFWLDFNAEKQTITKNGIDELFAQAEVRAVQAFSDKMRIDLDKEIEKVTAKIKESMKVGDPIQYEQLEVALDALKETRSTLIASLQAHAIPYAQMIAEAGMNYGASLLPDGSYDLNLLSGKASEAVIEATKRAAKRMAQSVSDTLAKRVADIIRIGVEETATGTDVIGLLEEAGFDENRAQTIARTESARAYMDGQEEAWKASGVVKGKKWLVSPYACEFCEAAGEQFGKNFIPLNESFYGKGTILEAESGATMALDFDSTSSPPLHPNCRCSMKAELDYEWENE